MKNSSSNPMVDIEHLKEALSAAKQSRKYSEAAYKSQLKALKAGLKPLKAAIVHAEKLEKEAKAALKAYKKELKAAYESASTSPAGEVSPKAAEEPTNQRRKPGPKPKTEKTTPAAKPSGGDDLTKVKGVGDKVAEMLNQNGITSYADMAATSFERYKELLKANGMSQFRNPTNWASLAADLAAAPPPAEEEAPKRRGRQPGPKPKAEKTTPAAKPARKKAASGGDDLTKVKGVGDKVAEMLNQNGITSYADMAATSFERYKELLKANGMSQFRNPTNWASLAADLAAAPPPAEEEAPKRRGRKPGPKPQAEASAEPKRRGRKPGPKTEKIAPAAKPARKKAASGGDDLTKVKGVGDKVAEMLNQNGITSYADMAATSFERYKELLKANGMSQFRNPTNWASLAADLAAAPPPAEEEAPKRRGRQPGPKPQAEASAEPKRRGRKPTAEKAPNPAPVKKEKDPNREDDLTLVKGVGSRVADMLKENGIKSFDDMADTSVDHFKELLKANNMSRFRDPSNWPELARELIS
ncbi:MAG: helix-hairpin-helix domain-containing protein [Saprospiraceae bacterium]